MSDPLSTPPATAADVREIKADLHLHTCLSPCADLEMLPSAIVRQAKSAGLDAIAICDHNASANVMAVIRVGERESLAVIPGIEITSREEAHIIGLFASERDLLGVQTLVDENLQGENEAEIFGMQLVVDEWDQPKELRQRLLIGATELSVEQVVDAIHRFGGLAIAAHIDREGFGLIGQLGFIPPGLELDALEVSPQVSHQEWDQKWPAYPVITSSDAHCLGDIGRSATTFLAREASLEEIGKALVRKDGRRVVVH